MKALAETPFEAPGEPIETEANNGNLEDPNAAT